jgi:hypothetical protein
VDKITVRVQTFDMRAPAKAEFVTLDLGACQWPGESLLDTYKREQKACPHTARDFKGQCFRCGHRQPTAEQVERAGELLRNPRFRRDMGLPDA